MGPNGYYCSGLSKFKWIMDDKSMIMVSHSLFSSASYCPRIWMQWGWSLWTTTSQFVSPTVWHRTWATSEILRLLEVVYTTIQDRCEINHDLGKKHCIPSWFQNLHETMQLFGIRFSSPMSSMSPEVAMSLAERASLPAVSWMRSKNRPARVGTGWNRLEPAWAASVRPLRRRWRHCAGSKYRSIGEGEGAEGAEGDPEIGCFLKWNMMHHWIWGCMLVFRQTHMSKWSEPWSCWNRAICLGMTHPQALREALRSKPASTASQSMVLYVPTCSNIGVCSCRWFPHCFETIHFGGFCGFRHFGYSRSQTQSWLVANFWPISMEIQLTEYWFVGSTNDDNSQIRSMVCH